MGLSRPPLRAFFDLELQPFEQRLEAGAAERHHARPGTRLHRELPLLEPLDKTEKAVAVKMAP
jgi:hypothetical protein